MDIIKAHRGAPEYWSRLANPKAAREATRLLNVNEGVTFGPFELTKRYYYRSKEESGGRDSVVSGVMSCYMQVQTHGFNADGTGYQEIISYVVDSDGADNWNKPQYNITTTKPIINGRPEQQTLPLDPHVFDAKLDIALKEHVNGAQEALSQAQTLQGFFAKG